MHGIVHECVECAERATTPESVGFMRERGMYSRVIDTIGLGPESRGLREGITRFFGVQGRLR